MPPAHDDDYAIVPAEMARGFWQVPGRNPLRIIRVPWLRRSLRFPLADLHYSLFKGNGVRRVALGFVIATDVVELFKGIQNLLPLLQRDHNGLSTSLLIDDVVLMHNYHDRTSRILSYPRPCRASARLVAVCGLQLRSRSLGRHGSPARTAGCRGARQFRDSALP